jgi:Tfp pilus assembly protein PilO
MNRQMLLLSLLGVILVAVLFYFFAWSPKSAEIEELEVEIESVLTQQATTEQRIRALEEVRQRAPEIEADLATVEAIVPREVGLPSALRLLQLAADDSGVTLNTVSPGRPTAVGDQGLASISLNLSLSGSYFQVVDFLRRVGDPEITPRAILFSSVSMAPEDYPQLNITVSGQMFALVGSPAPPPEPEPDPDAETETPGDDVQEEGA